MRRAITAVAMVVALLAVILLPASSLPLLNTAQVPVPTCTYPTGTITEAKALAYDRCMHERTQAMVENAHAPAPTVTATVTETVTPSPDPTETTSPTPTETPTSPSPTATPTGVPVPADFPTTSSVGPTTEPTQTYGGSCTVTQNGLVIEDRIVDCQGEGLVIDATGVVIRNSVVNGGVFTTFREQTTQADNNAHPTVFTVESSRIVAGPATSHDGRALGWAHFVVRDSHVIGSHSGAFAYNKTVFEDNYIQTDGTSTHQSGLRMLKNSTLRGNTIWCKPVPPPAYTDVDGGCSADAVFYREFGTPVNLTIDRNYFRTTKPTSGQGQWFATRFIDCDKVDVCTGLKFINNLFDLGQGTDGGEFPNDAGDVWADNYWTDGTPALSNDSR